MSISRKTFVAAVTLACVATLSLAAVELTPTSPFSMSIICGGGEATLPDGSTVSVQPGELTFDAPEVVSDTKKAKAPRDYASWYKPWEPWPARGKDKLPNVINLAPSHDKAGIPILGGLYGAIIPSSVVVTSADGSKTFVQGDDYLVQPDWGQIVNNKGGLGVHNEAELKIGFRYSLQRIDLVQVGADGVLKIKKGASEMVCPMIPEADAGCAAVAGIYIAPWQKAGKWIITKDEILPIDPAAPVAAINPDAVSTTLNKLRNGGKVTIAIMGDSVTLGAEGCQWWDGKIKFTARDGSYRGRLIYGLRQAYPEAEIEPVEAYKGGSTTEYGVDVLKSTVLPKNPDLVTVAFGLNDATCSIGGTPRVPAEKFREYITNIVKAAKDGGAEVILITPMQPNPFLKNKIAENIKAHVQVLREIGKAEKVTVVDVYSEWMNMATRGIPPFTQLHNWINHPGVYGHELYADAILRLFE